MASDPEDAADRSVHYDIMRGFPRAQPSIPLPPPLESLNSSPWALPTENNRIANFDPDVIASDALDTKVILHPRLPTLLDDFLNYKRAHGSAVEQELYAGMSQSDLIARLIKQRCLHFVGSHDYTVLRDGTSGVARNEWLRVGTADEHLNNHIFLTDYLSYDEMMLASLLGSSGPTYFINDGKRDNRAQLDPSTPHQERGIIVGLVGARFQQPGHMDGALILPPNPLSPTYPRRQDPGVSSLLQNFLLGRQQDGSQFDVQMYKARVSISIETLVLEANDRAAREGTTAYVQLVGLGLGVWRFGPLAEEQKVWYVEAVTESLKRLDLKHVSTLEVAWVNVPADVQSSCIGVGRDVGVDVKFNKRPRSAKLATNELLVVSWAWDANTLPGNEYWSGLLDDSDDPAAVCCSTAAELHNPYVNPFERRTKVLVDRPRVATAV